MYVNPGGVFDINVCVLFGHGGMNECYPMNTPDLYALLSNILLSLNPDIPDGIPFDINVGDTMSLTFDSKTSACLLNVLLVDLLKDDVNRARLLRSIREDERMAHLEEEIANGIARLPEMLEKATDLRFGFSGYAVNPKDQNALSNYVKDI